MRHFSRAAYLFVPLIILTLLLSPHVRSQAPEVRFTHLSAEKGLSQSTVNAIVQDRRGFMWFGTQDGLNRYDGFEFTVFRNNPSDTSSISDNYIWCLLEDPEGSLWAGTQNGGAVRLRGDGRTFTRYIHDPADGRSLSSNAVTALCETSQGELWLGTWGGGLDRFSGGGFEHFTETREPGSAIPNNFIRCLAEDRSGTLWIGTWGGGLAAYDGHTGRFRQFRHNAADPRSLSGDLVSSLQIDADGVLWVGTFDQGLNRYDAARGDFTIFRNIPGRPGTLSSNNVVALCEDRERFLWAGTRDGGVNRYDPRTGTFTAYRRNQGDPSAPGSDRISSLFVDPTGGIWVGTNDAGVDHYDPEAPKFRNRILDASGSADLRGTVVRAILEDSRGDIWVGTGSTGLERYERSTGMHVHFGHTPGQAGSIAGDAVMALCEDRRGRIWVGMDGGGLDRFDRVNNTFIHYWAGEKRKRRVSGKSVMSIYQDSGGELLVGMSGAGVDIYDPTRDRFVPFETAFGLSERIGDNIWSIREDRKNRLWFGTWGEGLCMVDRESGAVKRYRYIPGDSSSPGNNTVWSIFEDGKGLLWCGTWGGGLNMFNPSTDRFVRYTERDGLPNNVVYGVLPDDRGNLWMSTNKGLTKFDPAAISFTSFDHRDGLQGDEFNQGAYCRGRTGLLYFGGINGLSSFQPDSIRPNPHVPPVVLTRFRVFDREIAFAKPLSDVGRVPLDYDENFISFEFAALSYAEPEKNQYAYKLEGIDRNWIYSGSRRYAAYTHLPGGTYTFRVKGSNNDGLWNEQGASLEIDISQPFWRRGWFVSLVVFGLGLSAFALIRYRLAKAVEMERLRTSIASDLHDELASNLSSIAMFSNILQNASAGSGHLDGEHQQLLGRISTLSQESVTSIRDIIWAINPKSESLSDLLVRTKDHFLPLCRVAGIVLRFTDPAQGALPGKNLKPGERKEIWLFLKEAITNAIRHSKCGTLEVAYAYAGGVLSINVTDDGSGFTPSSESSGNGLHTMNLRAARLRGSLVITSSEGNGTVVHLAVKI